MASGIARLKTRFGDRAFDAETIQLVWREVRFMRDDEFDRLIDVLISTRPHSRPPLVQDFRDARLAIEKRRLAFESEGASRAMAHGYQKGLKSYLEANFKGCFSLNDAIAVRRLQIEIARAENPNYDPMTDPKWTRTP